MMIMRSEPSTICIVDPAPDDYGTLAATASSQTQRLKIVGSGRAALRIDPHFSPDLWIININLPDMSGLDLYSMIRSRYPGVPVYLVTDRYSTEEEIQARSSGATMYFCKPLQREWFLRRGAHTQPAAS